MSGTGNLPVEERRCPSRKPSTSKARIRELLSGGCTLMNEERDDIDAALTELLELRAEKVRAEKYEAMLQRVEQDTRKGKL